MTHNKFNNELQHFSIRKLSVGAASVLIGISFLAGNKANTVKADTVNDSSNDAKAVQEDNSADQEVANNYQSSDQTQSADTKIQSDSVKTDTAKSQASGMTFDKSENDSAVQKTVQNQTPVKQETVQASQNAVKKSAPAETQKSAVTTKNVANDSQKAVQTPTEAPQKESRVSSVAESVSQRSINLLEARRSHQLTANVNAANVQYSKSALFTPMVLAAATDGTTIPGMTIDPGDIPEGGKTIHVGVGFQAQDMNGYITYIEGNNQVSKQTITGKTDQTVNFTPQLPDGYVPANGTTAPTSLHLTVGMKPKKVPVQHGVYNAPNGEGHNSGDIIPGTTGRRFGTGASFNDLNRTISRVITINTPDTHDAQGHLVKGTSRTETQSETWYRGASIDMVNGNVLNYTAWTLKPGSANQMPVFVPSGIDGYTAHVSDPDQTSTTNQVNQLTPGASAIDGWQQASHNATVTYSANSQNVTFIYWDDELNKEISRTTKSGVTDQTINTDLANPANYDVKSGSIPSTYLFRASNPNVTIHFTHHIFTHHHDDHNLPNVNESDYQEKVTRTVTINVPSGNVTIDSQGHQQVASTPQDKSQTVTLTRDFQYDEVSHKVVGHGAWSTGTFAPITVNVPQGYTVNVTGATLTGGQIPSDTARDGYTDPRINVTFTANKGQQTINYTDSTGKIIGTSVIQGVTDQTVNVPNGMPTGWTTAQGATVPKTVHIHANDTPISVGITHNLISFTPDHPLDPNATTSTGQKIKGGHASDLAKTITRTVTFHQPSTYDDQGILHTGDSTPHSDSLSYKRGGHYDDVTGDVTYDNWVNTQPNKTLPKIDVPVHVGYTPSRTDAIPAQNPTSDEVEHWTNPNYDITYKANSVQQTINFTNDKGEVLHTQVVPGTTDSIVNLDPEIPDGWVPVSDGEIPGQIIMRPHDTPINYQVKHGSYTVHHDNPATKGAIIPGTKNVRFPAGVEKNDLNRVANRYIVITYPAGHSAPATIAAMMDKNGVIHQQINFTRDATIDTVTGEIKYSGNLPGGWSADGDGTGTFPPVTIPAIPGYTMTTTGLDNQKVNGATVMRSRADFNKPEYVTLSMVKVNAPEASESASKTDSSSASAASPKANQKASDSSELANDNAKTTKPAETTPEKPAKSDDSAVKSDHNIPSSKTDSSAAKPDSTTDKKTRSTDNKQSSGANKSQDLQKPADSTKPAGSKTDSQKPADSTKQAGSKTDSDKPTDTQKPAGSKNDSQKPVESNKPANNAQSGQIIFGNNSNSKNTETNQGQKPVDSNVSTTVPSAPVASNSNASSTNNSETMSSANNATSESTSTDSQKQGMLANTNANSEHHAVKQNGSDDSEKSESTANQVDDNSETPSVSNSASNNKATIVSSTPVNTSGASSNGAAQVTPEATNYVAGSSTNGSEPASGKVTVVPANSATILPQTGSQNAEILAAIGVAASGLAILGLAGTRKRKNA